jgi:DNA polymerase-3 subunit chi
MPTVEFHILGEAGDNTRLRYACQLVEQAYEQNLRCYVYAATDDQAKRMDEVLWTFRDQAFIPHEVHSSDAPSHTRIMALIGTNTQAPQEFQSLLINLSDTMPENPERFARICEVVDADPQHKQVARERYKQYREQGCQLEMKNQ